MTTPESSDVSPTSGAPDAAPTPDVPVAGQRIPSLDGLRAISIAAVVLGHLAGTANFPAVISDPIRNNGFVDIANLGVRVFFVISGFLITGILMREARQGNGISLKRFYIRRSMRIFPAYYAFVATVVVLGALGFVQLAARDVVHAVTYTTNYDPDRAKEVGHLWSLAVEEQFYLLWPLTIILLGVYRVRYAAIAVILMVPFIRVLEYGLVPPWRPIVGNTFETTADAIAFGCLLALTLDQLLARQWFRRIVNAPWLIALLLVGALLLGQWGATRLFLSMSLTNLAVALAVAFCVLHPNGRIGWFLNLRPIVFVGVLSYSIYLWQQLFLNRESTWLIASFPINIVLVAVFALGSYYLIERPFLRWRPRVEARLMGSGGHEAAHPAPVVR